MQNAEIRLPAPFFIHPSSFSLRFTMSFSFYPGQLDYLARACLTVPVIPGFDSGRLFAAETGAGKTLMAIMAARLKLETDGAFTGRALFVVPGGTLRSAKPEARGAKKTSAAPRSKLPAPGEDDEADEAPEDSRAQWRAELDRFAPGVPVHSLTCWADYLAARRPDGTLPPGIYLTYYEAIFRNGARSAPPESWFERGGKLGPKAHLKLCEEWAALNGTAVDLGRVKRKFLLKDKADGAANWFGEAEFFDMFPILAGKTDQAFPNGTGDIGTRWSVEAIEKIPTDCYAEGMGNQSSTGSGIRCTVAPNLYERLAADQAVRHWNAARKDAERGDTETRSDSPSPRLAVSASPRLPNPPFDLIVCDEAHLCTNLDAEITRSLIRTQARWRFALTASPIPNLVSNLFSLLGWLCVPDWFKGGQRNPAWPYAVAEQARFDDTFLSAERDHTAEELAKDRRKVIHRSPVISAPARLLKLIKPTLAFISKTQCNPAYLPPKIHDVRVPLGAEQARAYAYYLNRGNIPANHPLVAARKQIAWLRALTADPAGFDHGRSDLRPRSNFNPKTITILGLIRDVLAKGEQAVVVSARVGQTDEVARRLRECGIAYTRIDSTVSPDHHAAEANRFKSGAVRVQLMGIKCAAAHSFRGLPSQTHLIIGSLEYSWGPFLQACGRVDGVNSAPGVNIWCVLHQATIEEAMFDRVATKGDAATICLHGRRVARDFKPVDAGEVLAENLIRWEQAGELDDAQGRLAPTKDAKKQIAKRSESECEADWPKLRAELTDAAKAPPRFTKAEGRMQKAEPEPISASPRLPVPASAPPTSPRLDALLSWLTARTAPLHLALA
jgi:hypothetical protein